MDIGGLRPGAVARLAGRAVVALDLTFRRALETRARLAGWAARPRDGQMSVTACDAIVGAALAGVYGLLKDWGGEEVEGDPILCRPEPGHERAVALARILADLDRCEHGRHSTDPCLSCPSGWSTGNMFMPRPGRRIGTDLGGRPILMPDHAAGRPAHDPASWRWPGCSRDTNGDGDCGQQYCPECGETP